MSGHVRFMDGLRGIAVLLVVLFHFTRHKLLPWAPWWVYGGLTGVEIFFFLSGFALFYPYAQHVFEGRPLQSLERYVDRRVRKIVPSYVLALSIMAIGEALVAPQPGIDYLHEWLVHLFFIHNFWWPTVMTINGPFWTLAIEVQFYILFPLMISGFLRSPWKTIGMLCLTSFSYRTMLQVTGNDQSFLWVNQLPGFFDLFGFGSLAAYVMVRHRSRAVEQSRRETLLWTVVASLAAAALIVIISLLGAYYDPHVTNDLPYRNAMHDVFGPLLFVFSVGVMRGLPAWRRLLESRWLVGLSVISYNLYIWNDAVDLFLLTYFPGLHMLAGGIFTNVAVALLLLAVDVGVAWLVTMRIERPILAGSGILLFGEQKLRVKEK